MGILGNGGKDDAWLDGNACGRQDAFKEVLELINKSKKRYPANWNNHLDLMLQILELWLKQKMEE